MTFKKSISDKISHWNKAPLLNIAVETIPFTFFTSRKSTEHASMSTLTTVLYVINLHSKKTAGAWKIRKDAMLLSAPFTV